MKALNGTKKSRFKMATYTIVFLSLLSVGCIYAMIEKPDLDFTGIVTTSVAGVLTVAMAYIGGDSIRKSDA